MTRALTRVPQQRPLSAPKPAFQTLLHGGSPPKSWAATTGCELQRRRCGVPRQERPNASKVSAASLRRTGIQRFGVNQNSTEARYALDCEFTAALGTLTSQPTDMHCHRGWPSKWDCDSQARGLVYQFLRT